jgi:hypothetical protein
MGDFNIAQFIGGIVEGMGKGLTSDKGGGAMNMEVIPKKKNAPPVIEMTPSQTAASDVVKGAGTAVAMGQPILSPSTPIQQGGAGVVMRAPAGEPVTPQGDDDRPMANNPQWLYENNPYRAENGGPGNSFGPWRGPSRDEMEAKSFPSFMGRRGLRYGGEVQDGETVEVGEAGKELVTKMPDGRVVVTPQEEVVNVNQQVAPNPSGTPAPLSADVMMQMQNPQYSEQENVALTTNRGADVTADRPPAMSLPDTVQQGPNDEGYLQNELLKNMEVKSSPWKDFGAALIQAGNNHFNNKNEPIRTWGEIQRDKRVAPLAAKLALVRDAKKTRMDAEINAARLGLINQQAKTIPIDDELKAIDIERKRTADDRKYEIQTRTQTWKEADRAEYWKQEEIKQEAIRRKDTATIKLAEARQKELERHNLVTEGQGDKRIEQGDKRLTLDQQKADQLNKHRINAQKIAAARKGSNGSKQSEDKINLAKVALKRSLGKAVKDGFMTKAEAQDILAVDAGFGEAAGDIDK